MKKAFTLIELVFVIIVIGILSSLAMSNFNRPTLIEAANQLVSHIRYTQHLAMMDNKFNVNDNQWYKGRWQLHFGKSISGTKNTNDQYAYSIYNDQHTYAGNPSLSELAHNPMNTTQYLSGGFSNVLHYKDERAMIELNLGEKYSIQEVKFIDGCSRARRIAFDTLGRPIQGNISSMNGAYDQNDFMVKDQCKIQLCLDRPCILVDKRYMEIAIEAETGYVHIL